jgi:hypothetical protein
MNMIALSSPAFCASVGGINVLRHFQLNDEMFRMLKVMSSIMHQLIQTFFVFIVVQLAFSIALYFIFGAALRNHQGMWNSVVTVFFMLRAFRNQLLLFDSISSHTNSGCPFALQRGRSRFDLI